MPLTPKKQEQLYDAMNARLSKKVREMIEPQSLASRIYPKLKSKPAEDNQPKRAPIDGWSHLRKK
jgi:hypothetical protein